MVLTVMRHESYHMYETITNGGKLSPWQANQLSSKDYEAYKDKWKKLEPIMEKKSWKYQFQSNPIWSPIFGYRKLF